MTSHSCSRRDLLANGAKAFAAAACLPAAHGLGPAAAATTDYRALVFVLLHGGNDGANLVVPMDTGAYATYSTGRGNLAVAREQLLPITPVGDTRTWGMHPSTPELRTLFENGRLAVVANVGTLLQPTTRAQYLARSVPLPANLFSHSDQATLWQMPSARDDSRMGWGGRIADQVLALNQGSPLSPAISVAGATRLLQGENVAPYSIGVNGSVVLQNTGGATGVRRLATLRALLQRQQSHVLEQQLADLTDDALDLSGLVRGALATLPTLQTAFPTSTLGTQLQIVARLIGVRQQLGMQRQLFFVRLGGFDTHDNQLTAHPALLAQVSAALAAFQAAMAELGTEGEVTTCTFSEFGRSLTGNGRGSDHGWGGHQLVMGGAVRGRRFFGTMPDQTLGGPDDAGGGRMIPTIAVEQYAATLARWFGLTSGQLATVFPRLSRFATADLGFLA